MRKYFLFSLIFEHKITNNGSDSHPYQARLS